jgi:hypothetical protein
MKFHGELFGIGDLAGTPAIVLRIISEEEYKSFSNGGDVSEDDTYVYVSKEDWRKIFPNARPGNWFTFQLVDINHPGTKVRGFKARNPNHREGGDTLIMGVGVLLGGLKRETKEFEKPFIEGKKKVRKMLLEYLRKNGRYH